MNQNKCRPIDEFPGRIAKKLNYFFTDIDDTLSSDGQITAEAFSALWALCRSGIKVVPVTGRPAGWCDMIARMWPVEAVIGENGAFYFHYNRNTRKMQREFFQSAAQREKGRLLLNELRQKVLKNVPGCSISADQPYRIADLAIDFCEDVEPLERTDVEKICTLASELSLTCKVSSIHVNCWYGNFDKVTCLKNFLSSHCGISLEEIQENIVFIGDSPNDEPMFSEVKYSMAVANIRSFLDSLTHLPAYITRLPSGDGFQEAVHQILTAR